MAHHVDSPWPRRSIPDGQQLPKQQSDSKARRDLPVLRAEATVVHEHAFQCAAQGGETRNLGARD